MEEVEIQKKNEEEEGETIYNYKEYYIKDEINDYILRLEIYEKNINIIISINNNMEYIYKTQMSLSTIVNKLELNSVKYFNLELILQLFDKIYENKKLFININNNDESCILLIKHINVLDEVNYEIKLYKNFMKVNDKFNMLYNQFKSFKNNNIDKSIEMNNKIIELNNKLDQRDKEIKEILIQKDSVINEMNKQIKNQENRIKDIETKNINIFNGNKNLNELFNKHENEIKIINEKLSNLENHIKDIIKSNSFQINNMREEINKLNNKVEEKEKDKIIYDKKIDDKIKEELNKIENNINMKFNELQNIKINKTIHDIKYENKINYEFKKEPKNLKFKENITTTNTSWGWNDMFEIFISYKDNKEYLVSPNAKNHKLDIFSLINNQLITSLSGHNNIIRTIRYFINNKNKMEYLISADDNKILIIWDITNYFNIKYKINTKYGSDIFSCLLIFPHNRDNNYIITTTYNKSGNDEDSATKLYSLNNGNFIKYINNTNNNYIYYLISWYHKRNNKYYIIQFSYKKIIINNLLEDELYSELINEPEDNHFSGFIYFKDNIDYLCSSTSNGFINIWDLYDKKIFKVINTNGYIYGSCLAHIIKWDKKYIIVADFYNKSFKIIDIDNDSIFNINPEHKDKLVCVKKINHPKYGESLLSASQDETIKLWTIE